MSSVLRFQLLFSSGISHLTGNTNFWSPWGSKLLFLLSSSSSSSSSSWSSLLLSSSLSPSFSSSDCPLWWSVSLCVWQFWLWTLTYLHLLCGKSRGLNWGFFQNFCFLLWETFLHAFPDSWYNPRKFRLSVPRSPSPIMSVCLEPSVLWKELHSRPKKQITL